MSNEIEGTISIVAALLVLFTAMIDRAGGWARRVRAGGAWHARVCQKSPAAAGKGDLT